MVYVQLNNMYINIGANNGSEKLLKKTLRLTVIYINPSNSSIEKYFQYDS